MKNNYKKIVGIIIAVLTAVILLLQAYSNYKETGKVDTDKISEAIETVVDELQKEVVVSEETEERVIQTKEAINSNEDIATTEVIESSEEEENSIEEEQLELDAQVEQENISYDGDSTGSGLSLLGSYQGLTYYSQADSRWANVMYSSIGNTSQTMKSSACRTNKCCNSCKF